MPVIFFFAFSQYAAALFMSWPSILTGSLLKSAPSPTEQEGGMTEYVFCISSLPSVRDEMSTAVQSARRSAAFEREASEQLKHSAQTVS